MVAKARVVDMSDVRDASQFNTKRIPAGDYLGKIIAVEDRPTKNGDPQWEVAIQLQKRKTSVFPYRIQFSQNTLWKLRGLCLACGLAVPRSKVKVDPAKLLNKLLAVVIDDDEYEGKLRSKIEDVFPASELEDSGDADPEDEGDEDEDEEEDGVVDTEEEEDEEEEEPEPQPARRVAKKAAGARKPSPVKEEDLDELDLDDM